MTSWNPKTHPHPYQHGPIGGPSRKLHLSAFLFRRRKLCAQPCMLDVLPRDRSNSKESLTWLANALSSHTAAAPWANARVSPNGAPHLYFTPVPGCPFAPISHPYGEMFTGDLFFPLPETLAGDFFRARTLAAHVCFPKGSSRLYSHRMFPGDFFRVYRRHLLETVFPFPGGFPTPMVGFSAIGIGQYNPRAAWPIPGAYNASLPNCAT